MEIQLTTWYFSLIWGIVNWHFTGFDDFINLKENVSMSKSKKSAYAGFIFAVLIMIALVIVAVYTATLFPMMEHYAWMTCSFPLWFAFSALIGEDDSRKFDSPQAFTLAAVTFLLNSFDDIGVNFAVCLANPVDVIIGYSIGVFIGAITTIAMVCGYEKYKDKRFLKYLEIPMIKAICLFVVADYILTTKIPIVYLQNFNINQELLGFVFFPAFCLSVSYLIHIVNQKKVIT